MSAAGARRAPLPGPRRRHPPGLLRSVRFRLTALYSAMLFALAALVIGTIYLALSRSYRVLRRSRSAGRSSSLCSS